MFSPPCKDFLAYCGQTLVYRGLHGVYHPALYFNGNYLKNLDFILMCVYNVPIFIF